MPTSRARPSRAILALVVLSSAGCAEWPRSAHLPDPDENLVIAGTDPRDLFTLTWTSVAEAEGNDVPAAAQRTSMQLDVGSVYSGILEGSGWWDDAEPDVIDGSECGSSGDRSPMPAGDYIGDVDFYAFTATEAGMLCARAAMGDPSFGWDLVVYPIDSCGVPGEALLGADAPLGVDLGGPNGGWGVEIAPGDYAVLLASYDPNDLESTLSYELGLSLVVPTQSGGAPLCPLLPSEASEE